MPRKPSCLCGECGKCKRRIAAKAVYDSMTIEERREWVARRDTAKVRAADRTRYYRDPEKRKAAMARWRAMNPERMNELRRADAKRNPERRRAYGVVRRALASGRLVKPDACQECGTAAAGRRLHAHHHDYAKPLEVRWLCPDCHGLEHRNPHEEDPVR